MRRYCTIPEIGNLRKWFERSFNKACEYHDKCYEDKSCSRLEADNKLFKHMVKAVKNKGLISKYMVYYPTVLITYLMVRSFGWIWYN